MIKMRFCLAMGMLSFFSIIMYGSGTTSSETSYTATLSILNNSLNRDYVALPIIQLNVNENLTTSQVTVQGLSNFKIINQIIYNTNTESMDGTIVNEFYDIMTLCPKKPGNYTIKAIINDGKGSFSSNTMTFNITPRVYNELNSLISCNTNSKNSKNRNQIQAVKFSDTDSIAYVPIAY